MSQNTNYTKRVAKPLVYDNGGLHICGIKDLKIIENAWTHLLRSSCLVMFEDLGAKESIRMRKARHRPRNMAQVYTRMDIQAVLDWEDEHLSVCPAKPDVNDKTYEVCVA